MSFTSKCQAWVKAKPAILEQPLDTTSNLTEYLAVAVNYLIYMEFSLYNKLDPHLQENLDISSLEEQQSNPVSTETHWQDLELAIHWIAERHRNFLTICQSMMIILVNLVGGSNTIVEAVTIIIKNQTMWIRLNNPEFMNTMEVGLFYVKSTTRPYGFASIT
ncbi:hypothetical protein PAXINDRAFT_156927 [Paxillus involutus ATCC 200175]|uniref:Uncharacterized protein n=1 Tax=Paxillus involutus ATCC 200175 TaxID=664439 RepID=A0A0C9SU49_PAXIN|nr:hypothetical protein PAXINDRAFT_156927 [Paxillus involutus ATCC 200175]